MPVYVVTGARTGIGLEYIRQLSQTPSNTVFALIRSLSGDIGALRAIQDTARDNNQGTVHILECDVSSPDSIAALPALLLSHDPALKLDVLINNAATLHSRDEIAHTMAPTTLFSHIQTNVLGPALLLQALQPLLAPAARVANISSGIASLSMVRDGSINAELTPYSISKAALNMLTVHQARQLRAAGSRVVVVAVDPGHVKTEMGGEGASVEVEDSASGVLRVVEGLQDEDTGRFWFYTGKEWPW
ncbi:NADP-dependent dehydrogenase [Staphylotrichum tortipilum]|uniref:NADP-dependent dehydrogenase n=1 Tax=Staphylotrichum tortipilum TaxID=2831512 RepID=A0AAN6MCX3_9PEZI|nr:NADP-dependent dehydrogenase [Staphylotrichum longicolle]